MQFVANNTLWKILFVNPMSNQLLRSDGSRTIGVTDNMLKTIFIADNLPSDLLLKVLRHELCHVWCFELELHLPLEFEELLCDFIATFGTNIFETADYLFGNIRRVA